MCFFEGFFCPVVVAVQTVAVLKEDVSDVDCEDTVDVEEESTALEKIGGEETANTDVVFIHSEVDVETGTAGTKETKVLLPVKVGIPEVIKPAVMLFRNAGGLEQLAAGIGAVVVNSAKVGHQALSSALSLITS